MSQPKPATILVVDDDPEVTWTFARMLEVEDYDVRRAVSAETGLGEAELTHPDSSTASHFCVAYARADQRHTPVTIVTGDCFREGTLSNELHGLGSEVYFKPLWLEHLVRITHALVKVIHE